MSHRLEIYFKILIDVFVDGLLPEPLLLDYSGVRLMQNHFLSITHGNYEDSTPFPSGFTLFCRSVSRIRHYHNLGGDSNRAARSSERAIPELKCGGQEISQGCVDWGLGRLETEKIQSVDTHTTGRA